MARFRNPILPGSHPDPSICRAGDDYYLVTSTFEYFPGLPVHHSRDLVHWRPIGHVLDRPSQLALDGVRASGGLYAPAIRHHEGTFYVTCTAIDTRPSGSFVVTATDPAGPWSEPAWLAGADGFDPSLFFDADGTAWYVACRPVRRPARPGQTEVWLRRLDLSRVALTGRRHVIWTGALANAVWAEGPHLYRVDGRYYLLCAEGGTEHDHAVTVARSDRVTGPYEGSTRNPVLTHRHLGRGHPVVGTGHADLVETPGGEWWAVLLAMRPYGGGYAYNLGRETFLAPVAWEDGWPVFCPGVGQVPLELPGPALPDHPWPADPARDDFDTPALGPAWTVLRTPRDPAWSLAERPGHLRLRLRPERLGDRAHVAFVGRRQQHASFAARAALDFAPARADECAGLVARRGDAHMGILVAGTAAGGRAARAVRRVGGDEERLGEVELAAGPVHLAVEARGQDYALRVASPPGSWRTLAALDGRFLTPSGAAGDFTGTYVGMYATSNGRRSTTPADYDWFEYEASADPPP
ncbi:MAG TPA: glycoside hydrolase family 43 protein [Candidatus Dormibacteraeota bacterium]